MGGLCATTLDFLIPTFCYVKLSSHPWTEKKNLTAIIFFGILVFIGYTSVILTIYLSFHKHMGPYDEQSIMPRWKSIG